MTQIYAFTAFVFGTVFGSFYGVIIDRLPTHRNIATGRSECDHCHTVLKPIDLVPILSFILQRGRCRYCKTKLSYRYLILELLTGGLFYLNVVHFGPSMRAIFACILVSILIIVSYIDIDTMIINDRFHLLIIILASIEIILFKKSLLEMIVGALIVSLPLLVVAIITQGIGGGDIKLMAAAGLLLGPYSTVVAFIIGTLIGGVFGIGALLNKSKNRKSEIPFGPYLCIGIYCAYLYGPTLIDFYINTFF